MRRTDAKVLVAMAAIAALLVVGTEDMGNGHVAFANRGIDVQTSTNQYQGCVPAGGTSGITNACTATSGSTQTSVLLSFDVCTGPPPSFSCRMPAGAVGCNNIGCTSISCTGPNGNAVCTTDNGVQLTSCTMLGLSLTCTRTEPGTGITSSGGVTTSDAG